MRIYAKKRDTKKPEENEVSKKIRKKRAKLKKIINNKKLNYPKDLQRN